MEEYLGVYDGDSAYTHALCMGLIKCAAPLPEIVEFTKLESAAFFALRKKMIMLIVPLGTELDEAVTDAVERIIYLSESRDEAEDVIFKYQSIDDISRQLKAVFETIKRNSASDAGAQIYGIYSPVGRCCKTSLGVLMAGILSENGPSLFLTFDEFSQVGAMLGEKDNPGNLSDALYYYLQGELSSFEKEIICSFRGFDYLIPVANPADIRGIGAKELVGFIEYFSKKKNYRNIVIDFGNTCSDIFPLISICNRVYVPGREDFISEGKLSRFKLRLRSEAPEASERMLYINPPYMHISKDENITNYYDRLNRSELSDYIRSIV